MHSVPPSFNIEEMFLFHSIIPVLIAFSHSVFASELFFPVEKNHIQILPQRFEYQLIDKDQFQIGNVLVNANELDFQLIPLDKQKTQFKLRVQWPAGLLKSGEIAIKDNSGKAIFFKKIDKTQIKISSAKSGSGALASFETSDDINLALKEIQLYPFFKFCIHREEPRTKIYLCSKDLYLKKSPAGLTILSRDSFRPESFVEINGRSVGNQGMIFLNSPSEFISMRALLLSGATLELDTRMKTVEFKDVVLSPDGKKIIVRAQGAEPVDPKSVRRKNASEWEVHLETERPYTYLKSEGDLPLRQEFLILGAVRKEEVKVQVSSPAPETIYQNTLTLTLKASPQLVLAPFDPKKSSLKKLSKDTYEWTLLGLNKNEKNRRFLKVHQDPNQFLAAYDVERLTSLDASLRLMFPLWLQFNALWTPSSTWSLDFQYDNQIGKAKTDPDLGIFLLGAQRRFPEGIHGRDPAYLAEIYYQQFQSSVKNLGVLGLAVAIEEKNSGWLSSLAQWSHARIRLPLLGLDSDLKLKTSYDLELSLQRWAQEKLFYYEAGLKYQHYLFQSDRTELKSSKALAFAGIGAQF